MQNSNSLIEKSKENLSKKVIEIFGQLLNRTNNALFENDLKQQISVAIAFIILFKGDPITKTSKALFFDFSLETKSNENFTILFSKPKNTEILFKNIKIIKENKTIFETLENLNTKYEVLTPSEINAKYSFIDILTVIYI